MVPADQPNAVHVVTFRVWMDNGGIYELGEQSNGGHFLPRTDIAVSEDSTRHARPRAFEIIQAIRLPLAALSISNLILAAIDVMPTEPSVFILYLLRNMGAFSVPGRGGVSLDVWRYDLLTGLREPLRPLGSGLRSHIRDRRLNNKIHVTLQADHTWRLRSAPPSALRELPLPLRQRGSSDET